jgi:hypothetical protein
MYVVITCIITSGSVGIAMEYRLDGQEIGVRFPTGARDFSIFHSAKNESGVTHPPTKWLPETLSTG